MSYTKVFYLVAISLLLAITVGSIGCGGGTAGTGVRSYEGTVVAQDNSSVSNARVSIEETGTEAITDANGFFYLEEQNLMTGDEITFIIVINDFQVRFSHTVRAEGTHILFRVVVDLPSETLVSVEESEIPTSGDSNSSESSDGSSSIFSSQSSSEHSSGNSSSSDSSSGGSQASSSSAGGGSSFSTSSSSSSVTTSSDSSTPPGLGASTSSSSSVSSSTSGGFSTSSSQSSSSSTTSNSSSSSSDVDSSSSSSTSSSSGGSSSSSSSTCKTWQPRNPADPPC